MTSAYEWIVIARDPNETFGLAAERSTIYQCGPLITHGSKQYLAIFGYKYFFSSILYVSFSVSHLQTNSHTHTYLSLFCARCIGIFNTGVADRGVISKTLIITFFITRAEKYITHNETAVRIIKTPSHINQHGTLLRLSWSFY